MENLTNNKWKVRGAVLMIFLLGFVAGGLSLNAYHAWRAQSGGNRERQPRLERMFDQLQLTAEQRAQVKQIFNDTREQIQSVRKDSEPKFEDIRRQTDERLQKVLTPEQWGKFKQMKEEMRKQQPQRGRFGRGGNP